MIHTLIPEPIHAPAQPQRLGYALTPRTLLLLTAGCLLTIPGFFHPHWIYAMFAWDALVLILAILEGALLPAPSALTVERRFNNSPILGEPTEITLAVTQSSRQILELRLTDSLHPSLEPTPPTTRVLAYPRDPARVTLICTPNTRGDIAAGPVYLRYRGPLKLIERWAVAPLEQNLRVYPPMERSPEDTALYLLRIRQIALQKRRLRLRGLGREFESLREYQRGDELRNIAWPATARRGKLITREFTTERSQQVWIVLDAGRLSRTAFEIRRKPTTTEKKNLERNGPQPAQNQAQTKDSHQDTTSTTPQSKGLYQGTASAVPDASPAEAANNFRDTLTQENFLLTITQLDQSSGAAVALAQTVLQAGDKAALLVYGTKIQQQLLPAAGPAHLRQIVDSLSQVRAESAEANHLAAAARLKHLQRRRGLILWITELADTARRPEVVDAAIDLARRHLVLLVVLAHPELEQLSTRPPENVEQMYTATAATEILERRREILARLRAQGVLVVETTHGSVKADAINQYLEIKAQGML